MELRVHHVPPARSDFDRAVDAAVRFMAAGDPPDPPTGAAPSTNRFIVHRETARRIVDRVKRTVFLDRAGRPIPQEGLGVPKPPRPFDAAIAKAATPAADAWPYPTKRPATVYVDIRRRVECAPAPKPYGLMPLGAGAGLPAIQRVR